MIEQMIQSVQDLNVVAGHLRESQEFDRLRTLAYNWQVPDDYVRDFIIGKRILLADIDFEEKEYRNANEKLADEMNLIGDPDFAGIIGYYICRKCVEKEYETLVLQPHKSLQKCLDFILKKAYAIAQQRYGEDGMRRENGVGIVATSSKVFPWVDEYYALDDALEEAEKKEKAKKKLLKKRQKAQKEVKKREKEDADLKKRRGKETQIRESKRKAKVGQMSIFDLMQQEEADKDTDSLSGQDAQEPDRDDSVDVVSTGTGGKEADEKPDGEMGD